MKKNIFFICLFLYLTVGITEAQYSVLLNFNDTNGANPGGGSLTFSGNRLYGMTQNGGTHDSGCIFSIDTNGNSYKDLLDFNGTNGANPYGSLKLNGNVLYGMTNKGGANSEGCVFSIDTNGNQYNDLFDFNGVNGANPYGSLTLSGGILYGMTSLGGLYNVGRIFAIDTNGTGYKKIFDFNDTDGAIPYGDLTIFGGVLYGMTYGYYGAVFSIDTSGTNCKVLHYFYSEESAYPKGSLVISGSKLYGMTSYNLPISSPPTMYDGDIFSIDTNGTDYKDLLDFDGQNGLLPWGSLTISGNLLYGMAQEGGAYHYYGLVFKLDTNGGGYRKMFDFNDTDGSEPYGTLTLAGNTLYGMTDVGGTQSDGLVFKLDTSTISTASINNIEASKGAINLYPNPNNGIFTLSLLNSNETCKVEVYNVMGQQVMNEELIGKNTQIDLSNQSAGVYLYRVLTESGELVGSGKVVLQK